MKPLPAGVPAVRIVISSTGTAFYPQNLRAFEAAEPAPDDIGLELAREIGRALARQHHKDEIEARARLAAPERQSSK